MKLGSTTFLKGVIILIGTVVLALCIFALPQAIRAELRPGSDFDYGPILIGLYATAVPFFIGLYQAIKLLRQVDKNKAFTQKSVNLLKNIKYCALSISSMFTAGMPYIFYVADRDDAPGFVALGLVIIGASFVIATAAALFQRLFQSAVDIKAENDLTV